MRFTIKLDDLLEALHGCSKIAAKEDMRECLKYTHITCKDNRAVFEALDGFQLIEYSVTVKNAESGEALVDAAQLAKTIINKGDDAHVMLTETGLSIETVGGKVEVNHPLEKAVRQYVDTTKVWDDRASDVVNIAFNAKFLSRVAALCQPKASPVVRVEIPTNPMKPAVFHSKTDTISTRGMVLPVRVHE